MKRLILILICCHFFSGCEQISKSIDDTFKPGDTLVARPIEKPEIQTQTIRQGNQTITTSSKGINITVVIPEIPQKKQQQSLNTQKKILNFLTNISALEKAESALKNLPQYSGRDIFVYSGIHFYNDGRIIATLQHPQNPKYVDEYVYWNGSWSKPEPVAVPPHIKVETKLVSLSKINFVNVAKVTETYNEKAKGVEGAKPSTNTYVTIWDNQMRWLPSGIKGSREHYDIQFNDDGTLKSFRQE